MAPRTWSLSARPIISSKVLKPIFCHKLPYLFGDEEEVVDDVLRRPGKALGKFGVLGPRRFHGQVFRWHTRIMMVPVGHERRRRESEVLAPRSAATVTSRARAGRRSAGSHAPAARSRRAPAGLRRSPAPTATPRALWKRGEAPVPPSWPEMVIWSAFALATPAATVPTPTSATSFTLTLGPWVGILQVVDELREVLYRVDVVVGRR